jgi:predicted transcriptional regulator
MPSEDRTPKPQWLAFRADASLVQRIDELAAADRRSRASWLRLSLERIAAQQPTEDHAT